MRKTMKGCCPQNMPGWACGFVLLIFCISCAAKTPAPKPEAPPPAPLESKPGPVQPTPVPSPEPTPAPSPAPPPAMKSPKPTSPARAESPGEKSYFTHTVKFPRETVSIIAGWYTGNIENWKALAEANPDIDPTRIFVGNKILIPEDMMKTREPMPKEFVDGFYKPKKGKAPTAKPGPPPAKEEEIELFGPKGQPRK
jgi:hypothetical protein